MKPQFVFFDIGHTLAATGDLPARRQLGEHLPLTEKEIKRVGRLMMTYPAETSEQLAEAVCPLVSRLPPNHIRSALAGLWRQQIASVHQIPGAYDLLLGLKGLGLGLGVISNTWHPAYEGFRRHCPHLIALLDLTILSYQQGCKKPGSEIFRLALQQTNSTPEACWMIGDSFELDLEPARRLGMQTLWVLSRPEKEQRLVAEIAKGEKPGPDLAVQQLDEILPLFLGNHSPRHNQRTQSKAGLW
jgi:HAD superfamily hydrolase (TIGR01549 family)